MGYVDKIKAGIKIDDDSKFYADEINDSAKRTNVFSLTVPSSTRVVPNPTIELMECDTVTALVNVHKNNPNKRICVLNFASYTNPGGGYLNGAKAQEEDLCRESDLYLILTQFEDSYYTWNKKHMNNGLYEDRALYSPDVIFNGSIKADVLTCAAPYKIRDERVIRKRIRFMKDILSLKAPDIFVAGAWGCGVFKQDPYMIAKCFKDEFDISPVEKIVYAIPGEKKFEVFEKVINN